MTEDSGKKKDKLPATTGTINETIIKGGSGEKKEKKEQN